MDSDGELVVGFRGGSAHVVSLVELSCLRLPLCRRRLNGDIFTRPCYHTIAYREIWNSLFIT